MTRALAQSAPRARTVLNQLDPEGPRLMNGIKDLGGNA